jgi:hypothetical protein
LQVPIKFFKKYQNFLIFCVGIIFFEKFDGNLQYINENINLTSLSSLSLSLALPCNEFDNFEDAFCNASFFFSSINFLLSSLSFSENKLFSAS